MSPWYPNTRLPHDTHEVGRWRACAGMVSLRPFTENTMRSFIARVIGGAVAGASIPILRLAEFGPTESKILPFIFGVIAWSTVRGAGRKNPEAVPPSEDPPS